MHYHIFLPLLRPEVGSTYLHFNDPLGGVSASYLAKHWLCRFEGPGSRGNAFLPGDKAKTPQNHKLWCVVGLVYQDNPVALLDEGKFFYLKNPR